MKYATVRSFSLCAALLVSGCATKPANRYDFDTLAGKMAEDVCRCPASNVSMPYRYLASGIGPVGQPLVIFLHGAGGSGYDNRMNIADSGLGFLSWVLNKKTGATLVVPQCPPDVQWPDDRMVEAVDEFVGHCVRKFRPDESRIYITGYSMGGMGTWKVVQRHPDRFAAAVPVCGGPLATAEYEDPDVPEKMKDVGIWAFNGANDPVVQNIYAKNVMRRLWDGGETKAHFTESFNGHTDDWVYSDENVIGWMMQQRKSGGAD